MRINIVISLISLTCLHVSAKVNAQKITITAKDAAIEQVFEQIEQKSGYDFFYDARQIKAAKLVTLNLKDAELRIILDACFKDQPFSYSIQNKTIVVTTIPVVTEWKPSNQASQAPITIKGKVTDKQNMPLVGVSIRIKGTSTGTLTDKGGNYSIEAESNGVIIFSYVGYQTFEIKINNQAEINITMVEGEEQLKETVIKGYYNTTKELNTGNVSEIKSEQIVRQPILDPLAALQGQIPGLFIQQTSGAPGRQFTVKLRGQNSIENGNDPLYVVDGVPVTSDVLNNGNAPLGAGTAASPLASINASDIESIQVLKDADATAIYGSRGANGVILINTKKGLEGNTKIDINLYTGSGRATRLLNLMNTEQYIAMRREAIKNDNVAVGSADYDLNGGYEQDKYTDWQELMIGGVAQLRNAQLSISGGNKTSTFRLSGGYQKEGTIYPGDFSAERKNALASFSHRSNNEGLLIDFSGIYTTGRTKLPGADMATYIFLAPNSPDIYDQFGNLNWQGGLFNNPFAQILYRNKEESNNLNTNSNITIRIIDGLKFKTSLGYNFVDFKNSHLVPSTSFYTIGLTADQISPNRSNTFGSTQIKNYIVEPQLMYSNELLGGDLEALIGATYQESNRSILAITAKNFGSDDALENIQAASTISINNNSITKYRYNAIYARLGYSYKSKYVLNFTGRRDGSSRFGPGKQFGNFGAVGVAWLFGKENFIKENTDFLTFGKLRASFGTTGNDKLEDYKYLSTYSTYRYSYQDISSLYPTQHTNPYFAWERVNKLEFGLDLGFLDNRYMFNASWYRNRTGNLLVGYSLSDITGFRDVQANLPAIVQNTGLELEANVSVLERTKFKWRTSANISFPKSELVSYPNLEGSSYSTRYVIGMPMDVRQYYTYTGIDPATNQYTFLDVNGDGAISSPSDRQPIRVGQDFFGGWSNTLAFKGFELATLFTFAKQIGQNVPFNGIPGFFNNGRGNQPIEVLDGSYLQPFTRSTSTPVGRAATLYQSSNAVFSDASYIRFRNVSLSWRFPEKLKVIGNSKIYLQGQNIFTITKYKGLDPETARLGGINVLPPIRVLTVGVQLTL